MTDDGMARTLWQDYRFVTKEMIKFLAKQDTELFYNLMNQRERLQALIEQTADDGFKDSPEGQALISEIQQESDQILRDFEIKINKMKRLNKVSQLYSDDALEQTSQKKWEV